MCRTRLGFAMRYHCLHSAGLYTDLKLLCLCFMQIDMVIKKADHSNNGSVCLPCNRHVTVVLLIYKLDAWQA